VKKYFLGIMLFGLAFCGTAQKMTLAQIKTELEKSPNPPLYVKDILKKKFKLDTISVSRTSVFHSLADSLAYHGKIKKPYGPYTQDGQRFLVQILAKSPNIFYHISQIYIDTAVYSIKFADSLGNMILARIKNGESFEQMARTYSMGGEAVTSGDLGWVARGVLLPVIEHEVINRKKGEVFKIWSANGLHIIKKTDEPKQDTGFALIMRIFL
jgi:PPIC-type PPIASE domain